ncbi:hypothetical protein [Sulfolobus acidocaldarius]|uniref:hypothetical protein n=1 Tax=Sulfolobus acidocaldarius TaxID=2285 RepID=UPI001E30DB62|nr:hypothetical protein [Sulfolobus acidocaldarius]
MSQPKPKRLITGKIGSATNNAPNFDSLLSSRPETICPTTKSRLSGKRKNFRNGSCGLAK